ncbi:ATP-binding protein [Helicovermis profundi]|uniref:histidine kinase n=1 Tax=Helicovermis profundi TaxID=3065157 RepID=A0AAU9E270_9FIRM|nr:HAMP domain-containing sensor histidine kinase [Clostridia bacterium S502]
MQKKLNILLLIIIVIAVTSVGFVANNIMKANYIKSMEDKLISSGLVVQDYLMENKDITFKELNSYLVRIKGKINIRITVINYDGTVIADSDMSSDLDKLDNHKNRPEVKDAFNGKIGVSKRHSNTLNTDMYYVAMPLSINEYNYRVIRLSVPLENIREYNVSLIKELVIVMFFSVIISILLGSRFLYTIINPIYELSTATKRIANANFSEKIKSNFSDELGELAENFNKMGEELSKKINEFDKNANEMDAILSSTINGVVAVDNNKKVMFINPSAIKYIDLPDMLIKGKNIFDLLENTKMLESFKKLLLSDNNEEIELDLTKEYTKIITMYSNPIYYRQEKIGKLVVLQDVTNIRKLENMRKDFVANVSHELKTPLTSIKGFAETLLNGASDNKEVRNKFLKIIDVEAQRLSVLIEDILVLSEIENNSSYKESEIFIKNTTLTVIEMLKNQADKKGISINYFVEEKLPILVGNESWFKQMLINLIDNAVKYTQDKGEIFVKIYRDMDSKVVISIKDNGIGIDNVSIERLFERFYRVDKARSRDVGGTGLGLAIVKHVVISFDGEIDIKSEPLKGSEFIIKIPIN